MMKIGFSFGQDGEKDNGIEAAPAAKAAAEKSLVEVFFPEKNTTLAYYNDSFALDVGDLVFVEGKLEGIQGRVVSVSHSFKIKLSDYKRVIAKADTYVSGSFRFAGSHLVTLDRNALPFEKAASWYKPPVDEGEYISVCSGDGESYSTETPGMLPFSEEVMNRGFEYYRQNRVVYLEYDAGRVKALVKGGKVYTVEFTYTGGDVSSMMCECFCAFNCKHELAAIAQLKEVTDNPELQEFLGTSDYFAAVSKSEFFEYAVSAESKAQMEINM